MSAASYGRDFHALAKIIQAKINEAANLYMFVLIFQEISVFDLEFVTKLKS